MNKDTVISYGVEVCPKAGKSPKCRKKKLGYNFFGNHINVCVDGGGKKKDLDEVGILSAYLFDSSIPTAYYVGDRDVLLLQKEEDSGTCWHINVERHPNPDGGEQGIFELKESFFAGTHATEITQSPHEILSDVTPSEKWKILFLLILLIGGGIFFLYQNGQLDDAIGKVKPQEQAPKPTYPPLTLTEKNILKHSLSAMFFDEIGKRVKVGIPHIKTLRIVRAGFSGFSIIPQSFPQYNEDENRWYFTSKEEENMKRGGVGINGEIEFNRNYLNTGTRVTNPTEHIFAKTITISKSYGEKELLSATKALKPLTESCIKSTLYGLSKKVIPQKSDDQSISVEIDEVDPAILLEKTGWLVRNCPFYIEELSVSSSKFKMMGVLFPDRPLKKDDHVQD